MPTNEERKPQAIFDGVDYTQFARLGEANPVPTYFGIGLRTSNEVEQRVLDFLREDRLMPAIRAYREHYEASAETITLKHGVRIR